MRWIDTTGGPHIVIAEDLLPHWGGIDNEDYDRACEVDDCVGALNVAGREIAIFADQPFSTSVLVSDDSCVIVRWGYGPDHNTVARHLQQVDKLEFPPEQITVDFGSRRALLSDSSLPGSMMTEVEGMRFVLPAQRCSIRTLDWKPTEDTWLILHLLSAAK